MSEFGYREHSDHHPILKTITSKKIALFISVAVVVAVLVTFSDKGLYSRLQLERQLKERIERIDLLQREISSLKDRRSLLQNDPNAIEHVAREMHGMLRKGEIVYRVVPASPQ
jgi:cell division protein FtsB